MAATIKIALVSRTIFYAPVWVAEQNGYFRDCLLYTSDAADE